MTAPDLAKFAAAVRFRDRAAAAAIEHHKRAGLAPNQTYARATFDAIEQMIREDERERVEKRVRAEVAAAIRAAEREVNERLAAVPNEPNQIEYRAALAIRGDALARAARIAENGADQ